MADAPATLLGLAVPCILQALCEWSRPLVLLHFVSISDDGDADVGASAGLALTFFNCAVSYITFGFASAFDTLTSQAFGASRNDLRAIDFKIIGLLSIVFTVLTSAALLAIGVFVAPLVAPVGGHLVSNFLLALAPSIPFVIVWNMLTRWLRAQHRSRAIVVGVVAGAVGNVLFNIMFQHHATALDERGIDLSSAAFLALSLANVVMVIPLLVDTWIVWRELAEAETSLKMFVERLRKILKLGWHGILLTCGEIWAWEIQIILCAFLGAAATSAYTICFNFYSFLVMVPVGLRSGLANVVGYHVGRGSAQAAEESLRQSLYYLSGVVSFYFLCMMFAGSEIASQFSSSPAVQDLVIQSLKAIAVYQAFDGAYVVLVGALSGVGKQGVSAMATMAFYVIGIPTAVLLAFPLQLSVTGLWLGMGMANIVVCLIVVQQVRALDFAQEVAKAKLQEPINGKVDAESA
eukprot:TRINITY_DN25554_c0_g1_i1.p1 TRINITY_DN25554_c0_g1~~TRINITY_DN25554_c0_g1_i1.p1  ORF type:complete len:463 (-),score=53.57 TRINITY_DN25554_c0_g1_i1:266-1654(-)